MKPTMRLLSLLAVTALAGANAGVALADDDGHERGYASGDGYQADWNDRGGRDRRERHHERGITRGQGDARTYGARWRVTNVAYDADGKLSAIQSVVPLYDMGIFGDVTSRFADNGLHIVRVDAVYNRPDAQMPTPHYHFTQHISGAK